MQKDINIIALYLPQFYPIEENDRWWGTGFTEWRNVASAKPLFKGHNQPRIPADLGFYDLRLPEVRKRQADLARKAGVTAFCYWHYWFGGGKRLLTRVFDEVLASGEPDFPFCLGWANHSWYAKTWDKSGKDKLLIEQTYPGIEDARAHFNFLLRAFKDSRYLKIDGKPFLFIFDPRALPTEYITHFDKWAKEAEFNGIYLVANIRPFDNKEEYLKIGYSAVVYNRITHFSALEVGLERYRNVVSRLKKSLPALLKFSHWISGSLSRAKPKIVNYKAIYPTFTTAEERKEDVIPQLVPQWDHTPRSGKNGTAWIDASPDNFYLHAKAVLAALRDKKHKIAILKSWNEWGEGNYMEPDTTFGNRFIEALRRAVDEYYED